MENCRGRDREVKGSGSAHRRGDGLGSGPVGRADGYSIVVVVFGFRTGGTWRWLKRTFW